MTQKNQHDRRNRESSNTLRSSHKHSIEELGQREQRTYDPSKKNRGDKENQGVPMLRFKKKNRPVLHFAKGNFELL